MKKYRFEEMLPDELLAVQESELPVYLPIGSMEWHGVHMGMGVDTVHADGVAWRLAQRTGGAAFPPLYIGTETNRGTKSLKRLGFLGNEQIAGMDFPSNSLKSCYWPPKLFRQIVAEQVRLLQNMGFSRIVILNGHGAGIQKEILDDICTGANKAGGQLLHITVLFKECGAGLGHAGLAETSHMQALRPWAVDLGKLPPKPVPLHYKDFGIADSGGSDTDFTVRYDPRDSSPELGQRLLDYETARCEEIVRKAYGI